MKNLDLVKKGLKKKLKKKFKRQEIYNFLCFFLFQC